MTMYNIHKTYRTMKHTTILLALLGLTTLHLPAQTPAENRFIAQRSHSIGFNLYPVIAHLSETDALFPFEITYKYQLKGKDRAWRLGLLGQYNYFDKDDNIGNLYEDAFLSIDYKGTHKQFKVGAYIGHEWQRTLGKRWLLAIGTDVRYLYEQRNEQTAQTSSVALAYTKYYGNYYSHGMSLQPFAGLSFAITTHLLLYIDFKVNFTCNYSTADGEDARQVPVTEQSTSSTDFHFNLLPFQQISVVYAF